MSEVRSAYDELCDMFKTACDRISQLESGLALKNLEAENARLRKALEEVKEDCDARAVKGIVPIGRGAYLTLCAALEACK